MYARAGADSKSGIPVIGVWENRCLDIQGLAGPASHRLKVPRVMRALDICTRSY